MKFKLIIDPTKEEEVTAVVHARSSLTDRLEQLLAEPSELRKIPAHTEDEMQMLSIDRIECIVVTDGKTWAIDETGAKFRLRQRLYELEEQLPPSFFRINKSALANERHLLRFAATYQGGVDAVFTSGYREYVSRRCFSEIKRRY